MILSARAIAAAVEAKEIVIEPFVRARLNPNSYTFAVADALYEVTATPRGDGFVYDWRAVELRDGAWLLEAGKLYLATTQERLGSTAYVSRLTGRPRLGHAGLCVQVTADLGHQGAQHKWTLEFVASVPTRLRPFEPVGQISFWAPHGAPRPYRGVFGASDVPLRSTLHQETRP